MAYLSMYDALHLTIIPYLRVCTHVISGVRVCPYVRMYLCTYVSIISDVQYNCISMSMLRMYLCATMLGVLWTYVSMFGCEYKLVHMSIISVHAH
jgi:hypothetical protein